MLEEGKTKTAASILAVATQSLQSVALFKNTLAPIFVFTFVIAHHGILFCCHSQYPCGTYGCSRRILIGFLEITYSKGDR